MGVGEMLALGRELGMTLPRQVIIFAIEVEDPFTMATRMTPALEAALPAAVDRVLAALHQLRRGTAPAQDPGTPAGDD